MADRIRGEKIHRIGASIFVPASPEKLYEAVLNVRSFPRWAPGVRSVYVLELPGREGMISEWEISSLGVRRKVLSVLEAADPHSLLRWSYSGTITGWGECRIIERPGGTLANFATEIHPQEPLLACLANSSSVQQAARQVLKRSLLRLGALIHSEEGQIRIGPLEND